MNKENHIGKLESFIQRWSTGARILFTGSVLANPVLTACTPGPAEIREVEIHHDLIIPTQTPPPTPRPTEKAITESTTTTTATVQAKTETQSSLPTNLPTKGSRIEKFGGGLKDIIIEVKNPSGYETRPLEQFKGAVYGLKGTELPGSDLLGFYGQDDKFYIITSIKNKTFQVALPEDLLDNTPSATIPAPETTALPENQPAITPLSIPTQAPPPPSPTVTEIPTTAATPIEKPTFFPYKEIGSLKEDGFSLITEEGSEYEIVASSNPVDVPPGQDPTKFNLGFIKEKVARYRNSPEGGRGETISIILHSSSKTHDGYTFVPNAAAYRYTELVGNTIIKHLVPSTSFSLQKNVRYLNREILDALRDFLEGRHEYLLTGVNQSRPVIQELNGLLAPQKAIVQARSQ